MRMNSFNVFDKVVYRGQKFGKLAGKIGSVLARVKNSPDEYSVEFDDVGYVMHESFLQKAKQLSPEEEERVENEKRTRRISKRHED